MPRRPDAPGDYVAVVRARRMGTLAYVLADSGSCLDIQALEVARVRGRNLRAITSTDLPRLRPPASWAMAVVLCPGDTTEALAAWARRLAPAELDRVWFYEHPGAEPRRAYAGWVEAGLPMPLRDVVRDFATFHMLFGNDLNDRIYADFAGDFSHS